MSEITPVIIQGACMREPAPERPRWSRLKRWGRPILLASSILVAAATGAAIENSRQPEPPAQLTPEASSPKTTVQTESYGELWATNTALSKSELNGRLVSGERCIPFFVGSVMVAEAGQPKGVIENPIIFSDQDIFMPFKSHKFNVQTGIENYDYEPYAVIANNASASHEATYNVFLKDDPEVGFVFTANDGSPVEAKGNLYTPNEFSDHLACTTDMELQRNPSDQTYLLTMPDGTEIGRYTPAQK